MILVVETELVLYEVGTEYIVYRIYVVTSRYSTGHKFVTAHINIIKIRKYFGILRSRLCEFCTI